MSESSFVPGGFAVPDLARVATDQHTIKGSGTSDDPLVAQTGAIAVVVDGVTIDGDGTDAAPLEVRPAGLADRVAILTDGVTAVGDGTTGSPITVITGGGGGAVVADDVTITGFGTALVPLTLKAIQHDSTLIGNGTVASELAVDPAALAGEVAVDTDATLTGNGTTGSPLSVVGSVGNPQRFSYTVLGTEPDLTALVIALPSARATALYLVWPQMQNGTAFLAPPIVTGRTTTQFVLSLSAAASAGDVFAFFVADPS